MQVENALQVLVPPAPMSTLPPLQEEKIVQGALVPQHPARVDDAANVDPIPHEPGESERRVS